MGIPLEIFSLYRFQGEDASCQHYLLLKVEQPKFCNADQGEYDYVAEVADRKREVLIEKYETEVLAHDCAQSHVASLVGELQASPIGAEVFERYGGVEVDLWVAETRFGHPWVVLGAAENEDAFWREVEQDEDLLRLGASRPARKHGVFFLSEAGNTLLSHRRCMADENHDQSSESCGCFVAPTGHLSSAQELGLDSWFAEVSILVCQSCGQHWLRYFYEVESFTGSGRWYLGAVTSERASTLAVEQAKGLLETLDWYYYGGSYYDGRSGRTSGKIGLSS